MSCKYHGELTSSGANIENREGGEFSVFDGYAKGRNLELVPGKIIKQEWRARDWPEGEKSVVTFEFSTVKGGTEI